MKNKLQPKVVGKQKQKTLLIVSATGIALAVIVGVVLFFSLNLGKNEEALAASYSTVLNGNWSAASTWGGSIPNDWGNHNVTLNHNITGTVTSGQDKTISDFVLINLTSGHSFTSTRNLTLNFIDSFLAEGGDITINGNLTLDNSTILTMNSGNLIVNGNLTVRNGSVLNFNSSGSITVTGNMSTSGGGNKEININNGSLDVSGDVSLSSASTINIADGTDFTATNLSTGNNGDAVINIDGDATITNSIDLGGVLDVSPTGHLVVGNDFTIRNTGDSAVNIDGFMEVGDDVNINNRNMTGTGLLDWGGDMNLLGAGSINNQTNIPPPVLDLGSMQTTVLPVELLSFNAQIVNDKVVLIWKTASEKNNDYFTIERSKNGIDYTEIAEVSGKGTTNELSTYEYEDPNPLNGLSYYRLKQTDFDGQYEYSKAIYIDRIQSNKIFDLNIYPNPSMGKDVSIQVLTNATEDISLKILDSNGSIVYQNKLAGNVPSDFNVVVLQNDQLSKGVHLVVISQNGKHVSKKLIVN